jgi:hypothetical protein
MSDLRSRLDRFAERGEHRGAAVVFRRATEQNGEAPQQAVPISLSQAVRTGSGRWRRVAVAAVVVAVVVAAVFVEANRGGPQHVIVARPATTKQALATRPSAKLVWVDGRGVVEGNPETGGQVRLAAATGACQDCSGVRMGRYLFLTQPRILRVDTADGSVDDLGPGLFVFSHPDGKSLYVVLTEEETAKTTTTTIEHIDVSGHRLGGPWRLPAGQVLPSPPRAVVGGVLTQSNDNAADPTLSVWNPTTGGISRVGPSRDVIDTYTAPGARSSLVAYTAAGCRTTGCGLMITRVPGGSTRRFAAPDSAPGFIGGGSFSPDGTQLAVFVDRVPERDNPGGGLVIVTWATGAATPIIASRVRFGEPFGFATWSPDGNWVYFGGLSNQLMAHYRDTPDATPLPLPAYYSVVAAATNNTLSPTLPASTTNAPTGPSPTTPLTCLIAVSGGAAERPPGITGTLRLVGGPAPGVNRPSAGTISIVSTTGQGCDVSASRVGSFAVSVPPGRYTVTGHTPNFGHGQYLCSAGRPVDVGPARIGNEPVVVDVICPLG